MSMACMFLYEEQYCEDLSKVESKWKIDEETKKKYCTAEFQNCPYFIANMEIMVGRPTVQEQ